MIKSGKRGKVGGERRADKKGYLRADGIISPACEGIHMVLFKLGQLGMEFHVHVLTSQ